MPQSRIMFSFLNRLVLTLLLFVCQQIALDSAYATVIRFNSALGSYDVRMFDTSTPLSVANILAYVNSGDFNDSLVHRVENRFQQQSDGSFVNNPFVIQGGNFAFPTGGVVTSIPSNPPVLNEPGISNLRGTFALARLSGGINSGTNNWFINTSDNVFLDTVDQGFTVFGRVVNDGMQIVDAIANFPIQTILNNLGQSLGNTFPLHGDFTNGVSRDNFVIFSSVEELSVPDGDYDFDGKVDGKDFIIWQRGFMTVDDVAADHNGDAIVDAADLTPWSNNYAASTFSASAASIPEPSTLALLGLSVLFYGYRPACHLYNYFQ